MTVSPSGGLDRQAGRPGAAGIDERSEPELEHQQLPEPVLMGGAPRPVVFPVTPDFRVVEQPAVAEAAVEQELGRHVRQRPAQPVADRGRESALAAVDDRLRYSAFEDPAKQVLTAAVFELERDRYACGE